MPGTTTKLSMPFQVLVLWLHFEIFLGFGLTVTEINIKEIQKQDFKKALKMWKDVGMACQEGLYPFHLIPFRLIPFRLIPFGLQKM